MLGLNSSVTSRGKTFVQVLASDPDSRVGFGSLISQGVRGHILVQNLSFEVGS